MSVADSPDPSVRAPRRPGREARSAPARSREATRARLLAAATELFAGEGLHPVTSARIARAAGVATGTFYLHFRDKKALFREIVFTALAQLRERQQRAARVAGEDPDAQLRARTRELVAFAEEQRNLVLVLFGRESEAGAVGEDVLERLRPDIEEGLRARQQAGALSPDLHAAATAQALLGQTSRVLAWWVEDPTRADRDAVVDTLLRLHPALQATHARNPRGARNP